MGDGRTFREGIKADTERGDDGEVTSEYSVPAQRRIKSDRIPIELPEKPQGTSLREEWGFIFKDRLSNHEFLKVRFC